MICLGVSEVVDDANEIVVIRQPTTGAHEVSVLTDGQRDALVLHTVD